MAFLVAVSCLDKCYLQKSTLTTLVTGNLQGPWSYFFLGTEGTRIWLFDLFLCICQFLIKLNKLQSLDIFTNKLKPANILSSSNSVYICRSPQVRSSILTQIHCISVFHEMYVSSVFCIGIYTHYFNWLSAKLCVWC